MNDVLNDLIIYHKKDDYKISSRSVTYDDYKDILFKKHLSEKVGVRDDGTPKNAYDSKEKYKMKTNLAWTNFDEISKLVEQLAVVNYKTAHTRKFKYGQFKCDILYPLRGSDIQLIGYNLMKSIQYYAGTYTFVPSIIVRQSNTKDIYSMHTYFHVYLPLYDFNINKEIDIDDKVSLGNIDRHIYNSLRGILRDYKDEIKLDPEIVKEIKVRKANKHLSDTAKIIKELKSEFEEDVRKGIEKRHCIPIPTKVEYAEPEEW